MTDEEMWTFIEAQKSLQVATINNDGSPHLTTLWFAVLDGAIVFETFTRSQKIVNLTRDERIACLLEDGLEYEKLRGVQFNGVAELTDDPAEVGRCATAVIQRNTPGLDDETAAEVGKAMARKRTMVVVRPDRIVTWDHTKLGGGY